MKNTRGQAAIMLLYLLPLGMLFFIVVADVGLSMWAKLKLQVTADQAAVEAGKVLAERMTELAHDNHEIRQLFVEQEHDLAHRSQKPSRQSGLLDIRHTQNKIDAIRERMDAVVEQGYREACAAAQTVVQDNTPWASMIPLTAHLRRDCKGGDPLFSFAGDRLDQDQWRNLEYHFTEGGGWFGDPANVEDHSGSLLQYRRKAAGRDQQVAFALRLQSAVPTSFFAELFTSDDVALEASAAVQPYGGSIYDAAFADEHELAEHRYDSTLIPLSLMQNRRAGYRGLHYEDAYGNWEEDTDVYYH